MNEKVLRHKEICDGLNELLGEGCVVARLNLLDAFRQLDDAGDVGGA